MIEGLLAPMEDRSADSAGYAQLGYRLELTDDTSV